MKERLSTGERKLGGTKTKKGNPDFDENHGSSHETHARDAHLRDREEYEQTARRT